MTLYVPCNTADVGEGYLRTGMPVAVGGSFEVQPVLVGLLVSLCRVATSDFLCLSSSADRDVQQETRVFLRYGASRRRFIRCIITSMLCGGTFIEGRPVFPHDDPVDRPDKGSKLVVCVVRLRKFFRRVRKIARSDCCVFMSVSMSGLPLDGFL